jgi:RNA polymerase sigma-70 factor (ECF subfamily)
MIDAATFQSVRPHLFSVAYRMLGSASDAEDAVQDAWLRAVTAPDNLDSARAWLTTVVTRLCLDRLKAARARREEYVGPWLPEPVPTDVVASAEDMASRHESITMAFLVLLEALTPAERAAFVLREVFDDDYVNVAHVLDTSPAAARQLVHRARAHLAQGRTRFEASPERQREIVTRFLDAVRQGDVQSFERYLAADVVFASDGGGKAVAARRPVMGADAVGRLLVAFWQKGAAIDPAPDAWATRFADINGEQAMVVYHRGHLETVYVFSTDAHRITGIRAVRNPDKLAWLAAHAGSDPGGSQSSTR